MLQRSSAVIDNNKSKEFILFLEENAKDKKFWENIKKEASKQVDKKELDRLFE